MPQSSILVTGGAGFIGGALTRFLANASQDPLVVADKLTYAGNLDSLDSVRHHPHFQFVQGDICDPGWLQELFDQHRFTTVYHLAAESHVDRSIDGPRAFATTNVMGTFTLLEVALQFWRALDEPSQAAFRLVHVSTDEVYGSLGATGKFTETTAYAPNSPYSASKAAADHFARAYHATYGLPVIVTNCSNNYGPFQFPEKLIPLMTLNAIELQRLPIYGDGKQVRDWLHVQDHCEALQLVASRGVPGETYNIGGECEQTNLEIVRTIADHVDAELARPAGSAAANMEFVTDRPGHDRRYAIDIGKIRCELGWSPQHNLETGLRETVRWYIQNRAWIDRVASGEYLKRRGSL